MFRFPPILALIFLLLGSTSGFAYKPQTTTIDASIRLTDTALVVRVTAAQFLLPPVTDLSHGVEDTVESRHVAAIERWLGENQPVEIDAVRVSPIISEVAAEPRLPGVYLNEARNFMLVSFTASYPVKSLPNDVRLRWAVLPIPPAAGWGDLVDPGQDPTEVVIPFYVYDACTFLRATAGKPDLHWQAPRGDGAAVVFTATPSAELKPVVLAIPVGSVLLVLAGLCFTVWLGRRKEPLRAVACGTFLFFMAAWLARHHTIVRVPVSFVKRVEVPRDAEALTLFSTLHTNVYRAFDYQTEEGVYDALARSVDAHLLDTLYTRTYRDLVLREDGGAVCQIVNVDIVDAKVTGRRTGSAVSDNQLDIHARWRVTGYVNHSGHIHRRVNEYAANFTLSPMSGQWRIHDVDVQQQDLVDSGVPGAPAVPAALDGATQDGAGVGKVAVDPGVMSLPSAMQGPLDRRATPAQPVDTMP